MSRYLIIDITELDGSSISLTSALGKEMILSPEASIQKFKEIWEAGAVYGFEDKRGMSDQNEDWEEYSKKLYGK